MIDWRPIETRPTKEDFPFLVLLPANDVADFVIVQVSIFQEEMYPDQMNGLVDYGDRITNATHWCDCNTPNARTQATIAACESES